MLIRRLDTKWAQDDTVTSSKSKGQWRMLFCSGWNIRCYTEQNKTHCHETPSGHLLHLHEDRKWTSSLFFFLFVVASVMLIQFLKRDHAGQILYKTTLPWLHLWPETSHTLSVFNLSWHNLVSLFYKCQIPNNTWPNPHIIFNIHQQSWHI